MTMLLLFVGLPVLVWWRILEWEDEAALRRAERALEACREREEG